MMKCIMILTQNTDCYERLQCKCLLSDSKHSDKTQEPEINIYINFIPHRSSRWLSLELSEDGHTPPVRLEKASSPPHWDPSADREEYPCYKCHCCGVCVCVCVWVTCCALRASLSTLIMLLYLVFSLLAISFSSRFSRSVDENEPPVPTSLSTNTHISTCW